MPHKPYWHRRIPVMLQWLEAISDPVLDRKGIEVVFQIHQTEAQRTMRRIGAFRLAGSLVVTRYQAIEYLRRVQRTEDVQVEQARVQRLEASLEAERPKLKAREVKIRHDPRVQDVEQMPPGITLRPGLLQIEFFGTEDLLRQLYELGQIIANDYIRFESLVEG